jgi:hypothetical protein
MYAKSRKRRSKMVKKLTDKNFKTNVTRMVKAITSAEDQCVSIQEWREIVKSFYSERGAQMSFTREAHKLEGTFEIEEYDSGAVARVWLAKPEASAKSDVVSTPCKSGRSGKESEVTLRSQIKANHAALKKALKTAKQLSKQQRKLLKEREGIL